MYKQTNKAFTLVELIVVITILAILGTIAFISLQGYSKSARDSRRISDVNNIKTSLELFILNAGKYPLPDDGEEVLYSGGLLWTQGTVGDVVSRNLSKNLQKKPVDPLTETEYIFSVSNTQKEFELLSYYEGITAYNINTVNAASNYTPKISGTYNGVFLKTSDYIVPTPSIITSFDLSSPLDFNDNNLAIRSQVISGGKNFPDINNQTSTGNLDIILSVAPVITSTSTEEDKLIAINAIQGAYSGTSLASNYSYILSKTENEDKLDLVENVILNNNASVSVPKEEPIIDLNGNDEYTKLLLHMDGNDNGTSFTDSSTGSHNITTQSAKTWTFDRLDGTKTFDGFNLSGKTISGVLSNELNINIVGEIVDTYENSVLSAKWDLTGDFDIQFDYNDFSTSGSGDGLIGIVLNISSDDYVVCYRRVGDYYCGWSISGSYDSYLVGTGDISGTLRIERTGTTVNIYKNGPLFKTINGFSTVDIPTIIFKSSAYYGRTINGDIDNIIINSGTIINSPSVLTKTGDKKFGTSSALFGGDVSYLEVPYNSDFDFGSGDFTIDGWVNYTNLQNFNPIVQKSDATNTGWKFDSSSANNLRFYSKVGGVWGGIILQDSAILQTGQWYHVAVVRNGDNFYLFKDGIIVDSGTNSGAMDDTSSSLIIGNTPTVVRYLNANLDELRISKGIARWIENFTPPTGSYGE